jgi:hypothetical protein
MSHYRFVVLKTAWWECIAQGVPFLMQPGDTFTLVAPGHYHGPHADRGVFTPDVIMNPHRAPELCREWHRHADHVILYEPENLLAKGTVWAAMSQEIRIRAPRCEWWNYSAENARVWGDTPRPLRIPLGRREPRGSCGRDLDVLFVGSLNEQRSAILSKLEQTGLRVAFSAGPLFGANLALLERRARVVLNMHYYTPGIFESFRVVPAVARGARVVSEESLGGEGAEFCARVASYENLVAAVVAEVESSKYECAGNQTNP